MSKEEDEVYLPTIHRFVISMILISIIMFLLTVDTFLLSSINSNIKTSNDTNEEILEELKEIGMQIDTQLEYSNSIDIGVHGIKNNERK